MDFDLRVLFVVMAMFFVVGMAIYLLWKLLEPKREGESRSLMDLVLKPAAVLGGGATFIGICMIFPHVLVWTLVPWALFVVISFVRMPAGDKQAIAKAVDHPDPELKWTTARFLLAVVVVIGVVFGVLAFFVPD